MKVDSFVNKYDVPCKGMSAFRLDNTRVGHPNIFWDYVKIITEFGLGEPDGIEKWVKVLSRQPTTQYKGVEIFKKDLFKSREQHAGIVSFWSLNDIFCIYLLIDHFIFRIFLI